MTGLAGLAAAFAAGVAIGLAYFTSLWFTVRALPTTTRPAVLVLASYSARLVVAVALFVLIVRTGGWTWAASALAGFVLARMVMVRRLHPAGSAAPGDAA